MKKHKLKMDDPDGFFLRPWHVDENGDINIQLKEGELPLRPPRFYYEEVEE